MSNPRSPGLASSRKRKHDSSQLEHVSQDGRVQSQGPVVQVVIDLSRPEHGDGKVEATRTTTFESAMAVSVGHLMALFH